MDNPRPEEEGVHVGDRTSIHVARAVRGEERSLEWLVVHFHPLLEAQLRLRVGRQARREDVEDLINEVWLVVLARLHELRPRDGRYAPVLVKFIGTTGLQLANNFLRKQIRREGLDGARADPRPQQALDECSRKSLGVVTRAAQDEVCELVRTSMDGLSPDKRDVLVLRLMEQRSNQEIARLLGLEPNTVAVRYRRALEELRAAVPRDLFETLWEAHR